MLISEIGSRYIYDLYYEKEAISKTLYDWLLKNGYGDANLIAKWKKQGYEKVQVSALILPERLLTAPASSAASDAFRRKKPISTRPAFVVFLRPSSPMVRISNV